MNRLEITVTNTFKRQLKRAIKSGKKRTDIQTIITILSNQSPIPAKYRDHILSGGNGDLHELHIHPDWLLIYSIDNSNLVLFLLETGSHSDLFG
ncbi:toxin-antitoxin system, toxin component, RelE family [Paucilactobacillus hokkaidonensis JCM 18461]|uniref:Toxin-antitoxin system, toxin component, RelE family n=1 Tax=Paucilactobacillus hokkaidonensis JCM 18461 TaxID=1291742 RepID=A0A0A1GSU0_9LACO|nr:toxin-antitoxin system, toxin component, RelE family [Paucilactobacillus hokkaidonensis JCM 18461]